jgi:hypothetical protein
MTEYRAGYDVTECLFIEEATFGTTPTTGTWKPMWLVNNFDPKHRPIQKPKIGVGRQLPSSYTEVKKYAEALIELEMLAKQGSPAFEWTDIFYFICTNSAYGATFNFDKRLKSLSIGAKLDLTTDEYWLLKGCKLTGFEISGELDNPLKARINVLSQIDSFGTTDYVSGSATRQANPTSEYIKHEDCDITIAASSIIERLNNWTLSGRRTIERKGKSTADAKLYKAFVERDAELSLRVNLDFNSTTELTQLLSATEFTATVSIPSGATGRLLTLTNGRWAEHASPHRELDLISMDLTAKFSGLAVSTIA